MIPNMTPKILILDPKMDPGNGYLLKEKPTRDQDWLLAVAVVASMSYLNLVAG